MKGKPLGYIVTWRGGPMREIAPKSLRKEERGRLYAIGRNAATAWPTRSAATTAMRRAIRAWDRMDDAKWWRVMPLRRASP